MVVRILGGGVAGSAAAIAARALDVPVEIIEAPSRLDRRILHFKKRSRTTALNEPGSGLSRYVFDELLFSRAVAAGARHVPLGTERPNIIASRWACGGCRGVVFHFAVLCFRYSD